MAQEKRWDRVPPQSFTANGTMDGYVTVADASGFFAKQTVLLKSSTQPNSIFEVRVVTPTTIRLGVPNTPFTQFADLDDWLVADGATIEAPEQIKPNIKPDEIWQAVYERDPAMALRSLLVDKFGRKFSSKVDENGEIRLLVDALNGIVPSEYDEFDLSYDSDSNLIQAIFYLNGVTLTTLDLQYDADSNLIHGER